MGLKFSIYSMLVLTVLVAVSVAVDPELTAVIFLFLLAVVVLSCVGGLGFILLQKALVGLVIPMLYKTRLLWIVPYVFGRTTAIAALTTYGSKLYQAQKYSEAGELFGHVLKHDSQLSNHWSNRGAARYFAGDLVGAITDLSHALKIDSSNEVARVFRGFSFLAVQNYHDALGDYQTLKIDSSKQWQLALHRGQLYEFHQQWQNALDDYWLAYTLDSSQIESGVALARLQAGCPDATLRDGGKAVENATTICLRTYWNDWIALSVLAAAYSETGEFEKALTYAQKSHDLAPESEKSERMIRIEQYRKRQPFRVPIGSDQQNATSRSS